MQAIDTFKKLLDLGQKDRLKQVRDLPEASDIGSVARLGHFHIELENWLKTLTLQDRAIFSKALAVLENAVGGMGSASMLQWVYFTAVSHPIDDHSRDALEWILRNTLAYDYFREGATTGGELASILDRQGWAHVDRAEKEFLERVDRRARKAAKASDKLPNAVRRGDLIAVDALLEKGADAHMSAPDGTVLLDMAESKGRTDIVEMLKGYMEKMHIKLQIRSTSRDDYLDKLVRALESFGCETHFANHIGRSQPDQKAMVAEFQKDLGKHLTEVIPETQWKLEHRPQESRQDSIDIFGKNNEALVVIELDKHRADQVAKKFVSRLAILPECKIYYVSLCYPGTENMSITECIKYFGYCERLSARMGNAYAGLLIEPTG